MVGEEEVVVAVEVSQQLEVEGAETAPLVERVLAVVVDVEAGAENVVVAVVGGAHRRPKRPHGTCGH